MPIQPSTECRPTQSSPTSKLSLDCSSVIETPKSSKPPVQSVSSVKTLCTRRSSVKLACSLVTEPSMLDPTPLLSTVATSATPLEPIKPSTAAANKTVPGPQLHQCPPQPQLWTWTPHPPPLPQL